MTKSTASHHFKMLLDAGIVAERAQGTSKFIRCGAPSSTSASRPARLGAARDGVGATARVVSASEQAGLLEDAVVG